MFKKIPLKSLILIYRNEWFSGSFLYPVSSFSNLVSGQLFWPARYLVSIQIFSLVSGIRPYIKIKICWTGIKGKITLRRSLMYSWYVPVSNICRSKRKDEFLPLPDECWDETPMDLNIDNSRLHNCTSSHCLIFDLTKRMKTPWPLFRQKILQYIFIYYRYQNVWYPCR